MLSAAQLHDRAKRATNAGRHDAALALLDRARDRTDDPDLLALLDGTAAYAQVERGRLDAAHALCDRALGGSLTSETRGILHGQRAIVRTRLGRPDDALADFASAAGLLTGRPEYLGRALLNRGNLRLDLADVTGAAADYAAAASAFAEASLPTQRAKAEHNLGYARMLTGDLVAALEQMAGAQQELSGLSVVSRAIGQMDHAEALFLAGMAREGETELRAAIGALARSGARRVLAEARYALARHLADSDPAGASKLAAAAARAYQGMGAGRQARAAEAVAVAGRLRLRGGLRAEALAVALAAELGATGQAADRDVLLLHVYAARLAAGRSDAVRGVRVPRPEALAHRLLAADVASARAVALGRPRAALAYLAAALDEAQAVRARVGSLDLATSLSTRTRALSTRGVALAVESGNPALAYAWSERGRAHASRIVPLRPEPDAAAAAELAELRHLVLTGGDAARQAELRRVVREASWARAGGGRTRPVAGLAELSAELAAEQAALVSHLVVGGRVWAVVVADRAALVDCGPASGVVGRLRALAADLDGAASPLGGGLSRAVRASLDDGLAEASARLIEPVLPRLDRARVVLTPGAPLHLVPWGLLPALAGRGVTVARSATAWLAAGPSSGVGVGGGVLGIAGPGLEYAEAEARAAAGASGVVLAGPDAAVRQALEAMGAADVVHIAAHGHHFAENPLFSRVELADGPLFGYDLDRLGRAPRVVVLSACDVGAEAVRGDDLLGLPTALLHAGVRTVVASVARAGDRAARNFGEALHDGLRRGLRPDEAVARAVRPRDAVAPFVCVGRV